MEGTGAERPLLVYSGPEEACAIIHDVVRSRFRVRRVDPEASQLSRALREAAVCLDASMKVRIDAGMIAAAPLLKLMVTATTGADHIDQEALAARGIPLLTLKGQADILRTLTPAAEQSWLLLMACARRLRSALAHVDEGGWDRTVAPGIMLKGKILGIIGCGRIGSWMARYAEAFDMTVIGHDPHLDPWPARIRRVSLEELAAEADFITLHAPFVPETRGLLDRTFFEAVKQGAIFVNTSRGELIDEAALLNAMKSGRIGAAGLDVLQGEPDIANHPLRLYARENRDLIITPHIGGFAPEAVSIVVKFSAERILKHFGYT